MQPLEETFFILIQNMMITKRVYIKKQNLNVLVKENLIYGYGLSHDSYNNENPVEILYI